MNILPSVLANVPFVSHRSTALTGLLVCIIVQVVATFTFGDPAPDPDLPQVFCFRFTDIVDVKSDPTGNTFDFEFEVLNWTNLPASGLSMALTTLSDVSFEEARTDFDGRLLNGAYQPPPGNIGNLTLFGPNGNTWVPIIDTPTALQWEAPAGGPLLNNFDLLAGGRPGWLSPEPLDPETIDDGFNVMDGFVFRVSDFRRGDVLSLNWFLLDETGQPFSLTGRPNNTFGFGVMNLARIDEVDTPGPLFAGNTGFIQSSVLFAPRDSDDPDGPLVNLVPDPALFGAEFGGGITAPFLNNQDWIDLGMPEINTHPIPEPATIYSAIGLIGFCLLQVARKRGKKAPVA